MKVRKFFICCMAAVSFPLALIGCSDSQNPQMANELHFSLDEISDITISYDEETITFFEADNDELIIKEYMTKNKRSYYAEVKQSNSSIHISEGSKPLFKDGFLRYIEVYLPDSYQEALTITTTDGDIDLDNLDLQLSILRIDSTAGTIQINKAAASNIHLSSTSGTLRLGTIAADTIRLETTSGNVICDKLIGSITYTSTKGNAEINSAIGSGSYIANNSGKLNVVYTEVTGDLSLFNKNDNIRLTLPADLAFEFEATTKNGSVSTTFEEYITIDGRTTHGIVGSSPAVTIKLETNNGDIEVLSENVA